MENNLGEKEIDAWILRDAHVQWEKHSNLPINSLFLSGIEFTFREILNHRYKSIFDSMNLLFSIMYCNDRVFSVQLQTLVHRS